MGVGDGEGRDGKEGGGKEDGEVGVEEKKGGGKGWEVGWGKTRVER